MLDFYRPGFAAFFYPGPEVVLTQPNFELALESEEVLRQAKEQNKNELRAGIKPEQADALLQWMVNRTRVALFESREVFLDTDTARSYFLDASLDQACGLGQGVFGFQAELMGMNNHYHQINRLTSRDHGFQHVFSVVSIPVESTDGIVAEKSFLADTTFRQFFLHEKIENGRVNNWGAELLSRPNGKEVADRLLQDGYVELTPEVAELYVGSAVRNAKLECIKEPGRNYFKDLHTSTTNNDYGIDEMVRFKHDIRPPSMISRSEGLSEIVPLHKRMTHPEPIIEAAPMQVTEGEKRGAVQGVQK